ncbi:MAG TPA: response regulator [Rhizobiaceae bacterium]|nr:response regulator [Rhizobiaceae bacterium]
MKQCLIIDNSSVVRKVAKRILAKEGYLVLEASGGSEGLGFCRAEMPDMIILDAMVSDMTSTDFIAEALGIPSAAKPRILLCLVHLDVPAIMRAKRAGAVGYILKPFDRQQLLKRFREFEMAA